MYLTVSITAQNTMQSKAMDRRPSFLSTCCYPIIARSVHPTVHCLFDHSHVIEKIGMVRYAAAVPALSNRQHEQGNLIATCWNLPSVDTGSFYLTRTQLPPVCTILVLCSGLLCMCEHGPDIHVSLAVSKRQDLHVSSGGGKMVIPSSSLTLFGKLNPPHCRVSEVEPARRQPSPARKWKRLIVALLKKQDVFQGFSMVKLMVNHWPRFAG